MVGDREGNGGGSSHHQHLGGEGALGEEAAVPSVGGEGDLPPPRSSPCSLQCSPTTQRPSLRQAPAPSPAPCSPPSASVRVGEKGIMTVVNR